MATTNIIFIGTMGILGLRIWDMYSKSTFPPCEPCISFLELGFVAFLYRVALDIIDNSGL
jgi:hypothetical protein